VDVTALKSERVRIALRPKMQEIARRVQLIREQDIGMMGGLWQRAEQSFRKNGVGIYFVKDAAEARRVVGKLVGTGPVVKSKTNVGREIGIVEFLRGRGVKVTDTDCGDFLVDMMKQKAVHPVTPALDLDLKKVAEKLKCKGDGKSIKEAVRKKLESEFGKAKVGIIGANFVSADGAVMLIENEGNIGKVLGMKKLVVVTSLEKIVGSHQEGLECLLAQSRFATNRVGKFIHIIGGPSGTGDLGEYQQGMHGAEEMHIVVVDNGRSELLKDEGKRDILKCINCGLCVLACPVFPNVGLEQSGMRGVVIESEAVGDEKLKEVWKCTGCGLCARICPAGIDLRGIAVVVRKKLVEHGHQTEGNQVMMKSIGESGDTLGKKAGGVGEDEGRKGGGADFTYCC